MLIYTAQPSNAVCMGNVILGKQKNVFMSRRNSCRNRCRRCCCCYCCSLYCWRWQIFRTTTQL